MTNIWERRTGEKGGVVEGERRRGEEGGIV
jgi:hypothetical protein